MVPIPWMVAMALQADGWYLRSDIIWAKPNPMPESVTDRPTKSHEHVFMLAQSERYFWDREAVKQPIIAQARRTRDNGESTVDTKRRGCNTTAGTVGETRNIRDVWTIPPQPFAEAHFAVFPEALVRPCILAGTSERGACPECGAPWARVVERIRCGASISKPAKLDTIATTGPVTGGVTGRRLGPDIADRTVTSGWRPTCRCGREDTVPCVVLDPFLGSGTTAKVALDLGRGAVGIELNPEYAAMAERRCASAVAQLRLAI